MKKDKKIVFEYFGTWSISTLKEQRQTHYIGNYEPHPIYYPSEYIEDRYNKLCDEYDKILSKKRLFISGYDIINTLRTKKEKNKIEEEFNKIRAIVSERDYK